MKIALPLRPSFFKRFFLPGFAFKAVVIGGGYATGREIAEFFLPSGPWGGVLGMLLAMACWSLVCSVTFLFARTTHSFEYGAFFRAYWVRHGSYSTSPTAVLC